MTQGNNMRNPIVNATHWFICAVMVVVLTACGSSSPPPATSANTFLDNVILSDGTLTQPFDSNTTHYNATVSFDVSSFTLTPKVQDPGSHVSVNGQDVTAGTASQEIPLQVGDNHVSVVVTAQDGSTNRTYTFVVTRNASDNAQLASISLSSGAIDSFLPTVFNYSISVESHVDGVSLTATPVDDVSGITVNGVNVFAGQPSSKISLTPGEAEAIIVEVLAQDGVTKQLYTVIVTRKTTTNSASNSDLSGLSVLGGTLSPGFTAAQTTYNVTVANSVTSTKVTPTVADLSSSISVAGGYVYSGDQSGDIPLAVGNNSIDVIVTSIDSVTKTYTINVYREPRTNADLSGIGLSVGTLSPMFSTDVLNYTASVYYSENTVSISPYVADTAASVAIKGMSLAEGQTSMNVGLVTGNNNIPIVVTAQDGVTTKTYNVNVVRQPGDNASLSSLVLSNGTLLPAFSADTYNYSVEVVNAVSSISVTPTADIPYTQIRVNGTLVSSGQTSAAVNLAEGPNVVLVGTTSENGSVTITYTLNIHRQRMSPVFSGVSSFSIDENSTLVGTLTATQEAGEVVTYSVSGGLDQSLFSINSSSGELSFNSAPDYDSPTDSDANNIYQVEVTATSIINSVNYDTPKTLSVFVNDLDEAPVFSSSNAPNVLENETAALTVVAADPEGSAVVYSLTGGDDMGLFTIDSVTGDLAFNSAPDYETPADFNADNVFMVEVTATAGAVGSELSTIQLVSITVDNVDEAPVFSNATSASIDENTLAVMTVTATDPEAAGTASYSVSGGSDASFFTIDSVSGALSFQVSPDFEAPGDAGPDNVYDVEVTASFAIGSMPVNVMQTISVTVLDVNETPVITSLNTASIPENSTAALTVVGSDPESVPLNYSITGGADMALFSIGATNGMLDFNNAPSYEVPEDADANNIYVVEVSVDDGVLSVAQTISITVTDVFDMDIVSNEINRLNFLWSDVAGASYYKLHENPDGASGYTQVGTDIYATSTFIDISVHLTDWQNALYRLEAYDAGNTLLDTADNVSPLPAMLDSIGYVKSHNADPGDNFGIAVQMSDDGNTLVVGAKFEDNPNPGINITDANYKPYSYTTGYEGERGAVYVFRKNAGTWVQEAYIKPSLNDCCGLYYYTEFGKNVALSGDGNTMAASWWGDGMGKVFIYTRSGSTWTEQGYITPSNLDSDDKAGWAVTLSNDGLTLAFAAPYEDSNVSGIGLGGSTDNMLSNSGAVYVYKYNGTAWVEEAFIKAETPGVNKYFGYDLALSADGNTLVAGKQSSDVSKYSRSGSTWTFDYTITGDNTETGDNFGSSVALSDDGSILAVGAALEDGSATTIDGANNNSSFNAGAAYIFSLGASAATQMAYIKPSYGGGLGFFGRNVTLSSDGSVLAVAATGEDGTGTGVNNYTGSGAGYTGAVFLFENNAGWYQRAYIKATNSEASDYFGEGMDLNADGSHLVVGSAKEDSGAQGIGGDQGNDLTTHGGKDSGAVYIY